MNKHITTLAASLAKLTTVSPSRCVSNWNAAVEKADVYPQAIVAAGREYCEGVCAAITSSAQGNARRFYQNLVQALTRVNSREGSTPSSWKFQSRTSQGVTTLSVVDCTQSTKPEKAKTEANRAVSVEVTQLLAETKASRDAAMVEVVDSRQTIERLQIQNAELLAMLADFALALAVVSPDHALLTKHSDTLKALAPAPAKAKRAPRSVKVQAPKLAAVA